MTTDLPTSADGDFGRPPSIVRSILDNFNPIKAMRRARELRILSRQPDTKVWRYGKVDLLLGPVIAVIACAFIVSDSISTDDLLGGSLFVGALVAVMLSILMRTRLILTPSELIAVNWISTSRAPLRNVYDVRINYVSAEFTLRAHGSNLTEPEFWDDSLESRALYKNRILQLFGGKNRPDAIGEMVLDRARKRRRSNGK